ncbi:hypothetical protein LVY74_02280 [Acinetobacter sp. ME22]|uniref:hypothetical protein n=1 Tax=Acinetobacter sp. ME22 TaxID=2904802 RepID=UPI001EDC0B73|nr:hypothetical protein [Acinetobacter sp. ME22]MCG2572385.1 hypothetical protein [Acinetobacter sp. ME22]
MISALAILSAVWRFFCACFLWVLAHKRWSLIIVLVIYGVFQTWQVNSLASDLNNTDAKCTTQVNQVKAELKHYKANQTEANAKAKTNAITQEKTWAEQLLKVEQNASQKIQDAAAAARAAELANRGLSEQISRANQRLSTASKETIVDYTVANGALLEACTAEYRAMAEKADGHAVDAGRLSQAWDVVTETKK